MEKHDWQVSKHKKEGLRKGKERAVLVGLAYGKQTTERLKEYMDELEFLALTAGAKTIKKFTQKLQNPNVRTFVGKGKVEEIAAYIEEHDIDLVIFDDDLTAKQTGCLEEALERKIIDRSALILDIFASRAQSAQAMAQVELAQLNYLLPRLRGLWDHLERQRGGIGMRGPGEQEIETDRRIIRDKITKLKKRLEKIDQQNSTQRKNRGDLIRVALVGYTNVGKSTLMNILSKSEVFAENKLFATLDTTVRKVVLDRMPFLLSDTVGFIRKLPHHLVESFKSTLDEVRESDLLLHVVDMAHPQHEDHMATVSKTLTELGVEELPQMIVFNKLDKYRDEYFDELLDQENKDRIILEMKESNEAKYQCPAIFVSAINKENINELREIVYDKVKKLYEVRYPYKSQFF